MKIVISCLGVIYTKRNYFMNKIIFFGNPVVIRTDLPSNMRVKRNIFTVQKLLHFFFNFPCNFIQFVLTKNPHSPDNNKYNQKQKLAKSVQLFTRDQGK